jgi:ribosome maturation factor RimP
MPPVTAGRSANGPTASAARARQHLLDVLRPVVAAAGYDLDDVTVTAAGRRSLVRVSVDADGGIDLDAIATVSRVVSDALDTDADVDGGGAFAGPYVLEVSSPGVDRPLTEQRHWRRAVGRLVTVEAAGQNLTGRVLGTSDEGVTLDVRGIRRDLAWPQVGRGRVQVEFNRPEASVETAEED